MDDTGVLLRMLFNGFIALATWGWLSLVTSYLIYLIRKKASVWEYLGRGFVVAAGLAILSGVASIVK